MGAAPLRFSLSVDSSALLPAPGRNKCPRRRQTIGMNTEPLVVLGTPLDIAHLDMAEQLVVVTLQLSYDAAGPHPIVVKCVHSVADGEICAEIAFGPWRGHLIFRQYCGLSRCVLAVQLLDCRLGILHFTPKGLQTSLQLHEVKKPLYPFLIQPLEWSQPRCNAPNLLAHLIVIGHDCPTRTATAVVA